MSNREFQAGRDPLYRGWRYLLILMAHIWLRFAYRIEHIGVENIPDQGPLLLTANHVSALDVFALVQKPKFWIYWVGKKELLRSKFGQRFFSAWKMIPVDRDRLDLHTAKQMLQHLQQGQVIGIFPQGTRVPKGADLRDYPPKSGVVHFAVRDQIPILPIAIEGEFKFGRKVRIYYGKPYQIQATKSELHAQSQALAIEVMQHIYSLMGQSYPGKDENE